MLVRVLTTLCFFFIPQFQCVADFIAHSDVPDLPPRPLNTHSDNLSPQAEHQLEAENSPQNEQLVAPAKRVAVFLIDFPNYPATVTRQEVESGLNNLSNPNSMRRWVREVSHGAMDIEPTFYGWLRAPQNFGSQTSIPTLAKNLIVQNYDAQIDFSMLDHIFVFTSAPGCLYTGVHSFTTAEGTIPIPSLFIEINSWQRPILSFGSGSNYSSSASTIGWAFTYNCAQRVGAANVLECGTSSYSHNPLQCLRHVESHPYDIRALSAARQVNAVLKERMQWLLPSNIHTVQQSGTYTIRPLSQTTSDIQVLKIPRVTCTTATPTNECGGGLQGYYTVEYRTPSGFDQAMWNMPSPSQNIQASTGAVLLHADGYFSGSADPDFAGRYAGESDDVFLLDMSPHSTAGGGNALSDFYDPELAPGMSFLTPEGIEIKTISQDSSGATIRVTVPGASLCPVDANQDGRTNGGDLSVLLSTFSQSVPPGSGADFNHSGVVNGADLSVLLSSWGCGM